LPDEKGSLRPSYQDQPESEHGNRVARSRLPEGFLLLMIVRYGGRFGGTVTVVWIWNGSKRKNKSRTHQDRAE
jgi:hypothetical protein